MVEDHEKRLRGRLRANQPGPNGIITMTRLECLARDLRKLYSKDKEDNSTSLINLNNYKPNSGLILPLVSLWNNRQTIQWEKPKQIVHKPVEKRPKVDKKKTSSKRRKLDLKNLEKLFKQIDRENLIFHINIPNMSHSNRQECIKFRPQYSKSVQCKSTNCSEENYQIQETALELYKTNNRNQKSEYRQAIIVYYVIEYNQMHQNECIEYNTSELEVKQKEKTGLERRLKRRSFESPLRVRLRREARIEEQEKTIKEMDLKIKLLQRQLAVAKKEDDLLRHQLEMARREAHFMDQKQKLEILILEKEINKC